MEARQMADMLAKIEQQRVDIQALRGLYAGLREALRQYMADNRLTINEMSQVTNISWTEASRVISGTRVVCSARTIGAIGRKIKVEAQAQSIIDLGLRLNDQLVAFALLSVDQIDLAFAVRKAFYESDLTMAEFASVFPMPESIRWILSSRAKGMQQLITGKGLVTTFEALKSRIWEKAVLTDIPDVNKTTLAEEFVELWQKLPLRYSSTSALAREFRSSRSTISEARAGRVTVTTLQQLIKKTRWLLADNSDTAQLPVAKTVKATPPVEAEESVLVTADFSQIIKSAVITLELLILNVADQSDGILRAHVRKETALELEHLQRVIEQLLLKHPDQEALRVNRARLKQVLGGLPQAIRPGASKTGR